MTQLVIVPCILRAASQYECVLHAQGMGVVRVRVGGRLSSFLGHMIVVTCVGIGSGTNLLRTVCHSSKNLTCPYISYHELLFVAVTCLKNLSREKSVRKRFRCLSRC